MFTRTVESERLALIDALRVLDPALGSALDPIVELAAFTFKVPIAFVSIVGHRDQRFVSRVGLDIGGTSRDVSICSCAIEGTGILEVEDLTRDPRFNTNPLVTGKEQLRFYAGAPLVTKTGIPLGTICLMDRVPRRLTAEERTQLLTLSRIVMSKIELQVLVGRREPVTGLPNRQQFEADLLTLAQQDLHGTFVASIVDVFDVNSTNDAGQVLGMPPVESLLRHSAKRMQDALAHKAVVYHVGVARFAFVVSDRDASHIEDELRHLRSIVKEPVNAAGIPMQPQFHAGLCRFLANREDVQGVTRKCLVAMHHAIQEDRAYCWYSDQRSIDLQRRFKLAADAAGGLERGEFSLVFQPRYRASDLGISSAEALLRWEHPELGPVSPADFIPVIERTAMIRTLSRWVAEQAFAQAGAWRRSNPDFKISINLSPKDLEDDALVVSLQDSMARHGLPPGSVEVEITESQWLKDHAGIKERLLSLRDLGIDIAVDDFGTGYSNFAYLSELPISTVKLDRSLITGLGTARTSRLKVEAIIRLANDLGYRTVAEGVENTEEMDLLRQWQCDELQGFALARPMSAERLTSLLQSRPACPAENASS